MIVCEKLGYTLSELRERMTLEELILWSTFYELRGDEEKAAMEKAKRKRR
jgi:hypothetical protein